MIDVGLFKKPEGSQSSYSFFRNRIMFPVQDRRGRIVGFGGRLISGDGPKYLNSPESQLFHKGQLLYGLHQAQAALTKEHSLIVVEGYMDVISLANLGFSTVAPLGTSLTDAQIISLWQQISTPEKVPILCFDGDQAGRQASDRAIIRTLPLLRPGQSIRIAFLPEGYDPDKFVRSYGSVAFAEFIEQAYPLINALWKMEAQGRPLDTPESKAGFKHALEERITQITDRTILYEYRRHLRKRFDEHFGFPPRQTHTKYLNTRGLRPNQLEKIVKERTTSIHKNERETRIILGTLLMHPQAITELDSLLEQVTFQPDDMADLYHAILVAVDDGYACDPEGLKNHLLEAGYRTSVEKVFDELIFEIAPFARQGTPLEKVIESLRRRLMIPCWKQLQEQEKFMIKVYRDDPCTANRTRLEAIQHERERIDSLMFVSPQED